MKHVCGCGQPITAYQASLLNTFRHACIHSVSTATLRYMQASQYNHLVNGRPVYEGYSRRGYGSHHGERNR